MKDFSFITNSHPAYIEGMYQDFVKNPDAVDPEFRKFFEGFDFAVTQGKSALINSLPINGNGSAPGTSTGTASASTTNGVSNGAVATGTSRVLTTSDGVDWKKELGAYRLILG